MNLNFNNNSPIYTQLTKYIKELIVSGTLKPNEKLPSVRELALQLKINPNTVQKSLEKLEEQKLIYTERTNGKYITNDIKLIEKIKQELAQNITNSYIKNMNNLGFTKQESIKYLQNMKGE